MPDIELSAKQVAFYEENGFVVIEPVFSEAELIALREAADQRSSTGLR